MTGFCATLPELTDEQFEKIRKWANETSVKSDFLLNKNGIQLICIRNDTSTKDARSYMRLLRTNLKNWDVEMASKQVGWLKCITVEEYDAMKQEVYEKPSAIEAARPCEPLIVRAKPYQSSGLKLPVNLLTCP